MLVNIKIAMMNKHVGLCYPSLSTKSRNEHSLVVEVMPPHIILMPHYIDFS